MGDKEMKNMNFKILTALIAALVILSSTALAGTTGFALDPTLIGVGARPLGMGRAYVAVAEDADTIFMNPAGLGTLKSIKLMSMYSNLMGDVNYYVVGGTLPLEVGSVGAGIISSNVGDIWVMGADAVNSTHSPSPSSLGNLSSSVLFLSYGFPLEKVIGTGKGIYLGTNLKYFDQTAGGTSDASGGNGSGVDVDLGLLYTPSNTFSLGINCQNILPSGTITYKSGIEESIPQVTKIGAKVNLTGNKDEAVFASPLKVNLSADTDIYSQHSGMPNASHIGAEIMPNSMLTFRVGLDQDPTPSTVDITQGCNLTYGLGINIKGIEFNYAYHPFSQIGENTTHFFSISYVGEDSKSDNSYILLLKPRDKIITRKSYVKVSGMVARDVNSINICGMPVEIIENEKGQRTFKLKVDLDKPGKQVVNVEAFGPGGNLLQRKSIRVLRLATFNDISEDYWAIDPIEFGATAGLVQGYMDGNFQPDKVLSRAELAEMLVSVVRGEEVKNAIERKILPDLSSSGGADRYIEAAKDMGLVVGYPDKTFRPNNPVDRVEGISVATRFDNNFMERPTTDPYADLSKDHWASGSVDAAKQKGQLDSISSGDRFQPKQGLTRAEAADILSKTDFGKYKIDDLLDWNKGYGIYSSVRASK